MDKFIKVITVKTLSGRIEAYIVEYWRGYKIEHAVWIENAYSERNKMLEAITEWLDS